MAGDFIKIIETANLIEAEIIIQMLQENNIEAMSINKKDSSYNAFGLIEIYCPTNDVVTALRLINTSGNEK